jgi:hypothetical protein
MSYPNFTLEEIIELYKKVEGYYLKFDNQIGMARKYNEDKSRPFDPAHDESDSPPALLSAYLKKQNFDPIRYERAIVMGIIAYDLFSSHIHKDKPQSDAT